MAQTKLHLYSAHAEEGMPPEVKSDYWKSGLKGTLCGYIRRTTTDRTAVTCFHCLKQLRQKVLQT